MPTTNGPALPGASRSADDVVLDVGSAVAGADEMGGAAVAPDDGGGLIGEPSPLQPASETNPIQAATSKRFMVGW
jgi:hypothetical protein